MRYLILCVIAFLLVAGCEEIPPTINPGQTNRGQDTLSTGDQPKQVLIEEFTGIRCVNCPAGSQAIEGLKDIYQNQLVVVSIHGGSFANPYDESQYDFRTSDGDDLFTLMGTPFGYPSAVVNRKIFPGESLLQTGRNKWPNFIAEESQLEPSVNLFIENDYDAMNGTLSIDVTAVFLETFEENFELRLSVLITENDVVDLQLTPEGLQNDYAHKHVLRDVVSSFDGDLITESKQAGSSIKYSYATSLSPSWKAEDCKVVAFVNAAGNQKTIFQAHEESVIK